jgi:tRNA-modifying protein YgfZ
LRDCRHKLTLQSIGQTNDDDNSPMSTELKPSTTESAPLQQLPSGVAKLTHLGVIRAVGEEAVKFLQGQLTQDVALLGLNEARLAAFCSAKGRMQASFIVFKRPSEIDAALPPEILLICSHDILAPTLKRLSMFVMRAKVKLTDATADFALYGLVGSALQNTINTIASQSINTPAIVEFKPYFKLDSSFSTLISLYPAFGQARGLWVTPAAEAAPAGESLSTELWAWGEVHSGIATITAPIVEAFVPQMLNYESVGGVNFKKGCYPGQEVVARSQFRGTLKRRAYLVDIADTNAPNAQPLVESLIPFAGQEVFHDSDAEQPCGTVAQLAANPDGGYSALVSMQVSASAGGKLTLGSASGPAIIPLTLPYALLDDI